MKKNQLAILTLTLVALVGTAQAQITLGPRIGVSSSQVKIDRTTEGDVSLETGDRTVGFHVGGFARVSLLGMYIQPELLWTSTGGEIDVTENGVDRVLDYELNKIDIPVMVGMKFAFLRLQAGPVASFLLGDGGIDGPLEANMNDAVFGYQAGVGLDISKLVIDVKYEGNLSKVGDRFGDINVDQRNNQFLVSLGWKLF